MSNLIDRYSDLLGPNPNHDRRRLIADLDGVYQSPSRVTRHEEAICSAIRNHHAQSPSRRRFKVPGLRLSTAAALVLMAGGIVISLERLGAPPVSAETVLDRAMATYLPPNRVIHFAYRTSSPGEHGTMSTWIETNAQGESRRSVTTIRDLAHGQVVFVSRSVDEHGTIRSFYYEPASSFVRVGSESARQLRHVRGPFGNVNFANAASLASYFKRLPHGPGEGPYLLPERHLSGVAVYAVRARIGPNADYPSFTAYFDAHTYILRGIDGGSKDGRVVTSMRLMTDATMPLTRVPPHTFQLRVPAALTVVGSL